MGRGKMGGMAPGMMTMMFVMMDTDGNGALSLEEVQAVHARMFDRVDENDNGEVTMEEMRGFMQMMRPSGN